MKIVQKQLSSELRDSSFKFKDNKKLIILLFLFHFYCSNNISWTIYKKEILLFEYEKKIIEKLKKILNYYAQIKKIITENLHTWEFDRLGNVEKSILTLGGYYLCFEKKISVEVIIYFCIKNSELYCHEKAYRLINKVLHNISINRELINGNG